MYQKLVLFCQVLLLALLQPVFSQENLLDLFEEEQTKEIDYTYATFKTTRIVSGQSVENPPPGELIFIISHHFGRIKVAFINTKFLDFILMDFTPLSPCSPPLTQTLC